MARFLLTIAIAIITVGISIQQQCGTNQVYDPCGSSCEPYCHWDPSETICTQQCVAGCFCEDGFVREAVDSDTCIPKDDCVNIPTCGPYQEYRTCGSYCPDYCGKPEGTMCITLCVEGCFCKPGYVLVNANSSQCILASECPTCSF